MNLHTSVLGNSLQQWIIAGVAALLCFLLLFAAKFRLLAWLKSFAQRTSTKWDDFLVGVASHTHCWVLALTALWMGSQFITLDARIRVAIHTLLVLAFWIQVGIWVHGGIRTWQHAMKTGQGHGPEQSAAGTSIIGFLVRLVGWTFCLLMALSNLGIDITALVTGLGVGGIAIALAIQNILGDLFASLTIALDKPFIVGDFIIVGDYMGTVEYVGLKTTRLRSLNGEQIICSNSDLLTSRIRNFKRMQERRVVFSFGVTYDTATATLARIPDWVRDIIAAQPALRTDRVHLKAFGASSIDFEAVYYIPTPDYNAHMDAQQAINLALHAQFARNDVAFAFPTQTLHLATATPLAIRSA